MLPPGSINIRLEKRQAPLGGGTAEALPTCHFTAQNRRAYVVLSPQK